LPLFDALSGVKTNKPFGQGFRMFWGKVIANDDPKLLGRIKVQILELTPWDDKEKLLWIYPLYPAGLGQSPLTTNFQVPEVNTFVVCIFPHTSIYYGHYAWHWIDRLRRMSDFDSEYPERWGWQDSQENKLIINKDPNINTIERRYADAGLSVYDSKERSYEYRDEHGTEVHINREDQFMQVRFGGLLIEIYKGVLKIDIDNIDINVHSVAKVLVKGVASLVAPIISSFSKISHKKSIEQNKSTRDEVGLSTNEKHN